MKTNPLFSITISLLAFTGTMAISGCKKEEPKDLLVVHLIDQTAMSSNQPQLEVEDLLKAAGINESPENGIEYRVSTINDVSVNQVLVARLEPDDELMLNTFTREEEIQAFKDQVKEMLKHVYEVPKSDYQSTNLYVPLIKTLESCRADERKKLVILQSDMVQHSESLSFIREKELVDKNPEQIRERLEEIHPLKSLENYEFVVLYQPEVKNNARFLASANVFGGLFRKKGARVLIKANL